MIELNEKEFDHDLFHYIGYLTLSCKSRISEHDFFNIALASRSNTTKVVESVASITRSLSLNLKKKLEHYSFIQICLLAKLLKLEK